MLTFLWHVGGMAGGISTQDAGGRWAEWAGRRAAVTRPAAAARQSCWHLALALGVLLLASALVGCGEERGRREDGRVSGRESERKGGQTSPPDAVGSSAGGSVALSSLETFGSRESGELRRVVSWSPAASRFVRALGAESLLVGLDPASAQALGRHDLERAARPDELIPLAPDLLLIAGTGTGATGRAIEELIEAAGISVVVFEPHDLDDLMTLIREVGARLVGRAAAARFERELSRPLAEIGGASFGAVRPRVAPIVGIDPLELAGGHSFETDLIEIAGGSSITHGSDETRVRLGPSSGGGLPGAAGGPPDLFVYFAPREPSADEYDRLGALLPADVPLVFFPVEHDRFWLAAPAEGVLRLRRLILDSVRDEAGTPASDTSLRSGAAATRRGP